MPDSEKTYKEWVEERQAAVNENRIRAEAFYDTALPGEKTFLAWIKITFRELTNAFHALEWVENYRSEEDYKIYQALDQQKKTVEQLTKALLGLEGTATDKDVAERAKEFGKLVDEMLKSKETLDKATQSQK